MPKQNISITGNNFSIQNRVIGGGSYGIFVGYGATSNLTITNNTITFDSSGAGMLQFWGVVGSLLNGATILNNIVAPAINMVSGSGITLQHNVQPNGFPAAGL